MNERRKRELELMAKAAVIAPELNELGIMQEQSGNHHQSQYQYWVKQQNLD